MERQDVQWRRSAEPVSAATQVVFCRQETVGMDWSQHGDNWAGKYEVVCYAGRGMKSRAGGPEDWHRIQVIIREVVDEARFSVCADARWSRVVQSIQW
jgi:hypothetical protein